VLRVTELSGFIGAGLAGTAYVPQIWHLIRAHCSAGISRLAFAVWLVASLLVTIHAVAIRATVFITLGAIQLAATALILAYATKYENSYCATHLPHNLEPVPVPSLPPYPQVPGAGAQLGVGGGLPGEHSRQQSV
jgi:uncharacterized protein with PQ loop repeat